jgi:hypothetical protein
MLTTPADWLDGAFIAGDASRCGYSHKVASDASRNSFQAD